MKKPFTSMNKEAIYADILIPCHADLIDQMFSGLQVAQR